MPRSSPPGVSGIVSRVSPVFFLLEHSVERRILTYNRVSDTAALEMFYALRIIFPLFHSYFSLVTLSSPFRTQLGVS